MTKDPPELPPGASPAMTNIFTTAQFNDPVARKTSWEPLKSGGASFRSRELAAKKGRIEFQATFPAALLYLSIMAAGVIAGAVFVYPLRGAGLYVLIPVVFCIALLAIGGTMLYNGTSPIVFDKNTGEYRRGRRISKGSTVIPLERIHAIQVVSDYMRSADSSFYAYELNLVFHDGSRMNVLEHNKQKPMKQEANTLAAFLGVSIWDIS